MVKSSLHFYMFWQPSCCWDLCIIHNTKRVGVKSSLNDSPRPIVTTFAHPLQRLNVWQNRYNLVKPFGISEDLPKEIRFARTCLVPQMKKLKKRGTCWNNLSSYSQKWKESNQRNWHKWSSFIIQWITLNREAKRSCMFCININMIVGLTLKAKGWS